MTHPALQVPEVVPGVNVRALPLSALEGFVLSRVDGRSNVGELASMTGLDDDQVRVIIDRLEQLGALRVRHPSTGAPPGREGHGHPSQDHDLHGHARRRPRTSAPPQRRLMSEGSISQPAPDFRPASQRPKGQPGSAARSSLPPPLHGRSDGSDRPPSQPPSDRPESYRPTSRVVVPPPSMPASPLAPPFPTSEPPDHGLYDPRELEEDVDLPLERRKKILDLYYRLHELDLYELLDVPYDANKKKIRDAYFSLSKVFHPDSMFRKNLGTFKPKMESVFKHLTEAYNTLSKKKARGEYDRYLRATKSTQMAERTLRERVAQAARLEFERARVQDLDEPSPFPDRAVESRPAPASVPPSAPAREVSDEARRLARQVIERRLRGVIPKAPAPSTTAPRPSEPPRPRTDPHELVRRLARTLKDVSKITGTNDPLTRHLKASQSAFARGNLEEATFQMRRAISIAPDRPDLQFEHDKLSRMLSVKLAEDYETQASYEQQMGKWASAALAWSKVCEGRPDSLEAHVSAAQCMLKAGADLRGAQKYAQQAVLLAPGDTNARILLAQIYLTIGLKLNAKRELEAALKLDPANEMVKNLLGEAIG